MSFASDVARFAKKADAATDAVVRKVTFDLFADVVRRTPVGNPSLWKVNKAAASYNDAVGEWNSSLRGDTANLTKAGRLKGGLKVNDSMDLMAPDGYVGGRLRANWQVSQTTVAAGTLDATDKSGAPTIARIATGIGGAGSVTFLANNLPYAHRIEFDGWSSQAKAGMVRVSFARVQQHVRNAARQNKV